MGSHATTRRRRGAPTPVEADPEPATKLDWRVLAAILVAAAVPRVVLAIDDQGIFWPDEIFQSLEQAHRVVFGYGFIPWEFQQGARSWLFPGVFVLLWKLAAGAGVHSSIALVVLAKLFMVALAVVGIYATIRIAQHLGGATAGALAGVLAAAFPASLIYGHRCMTEMASGPVLALAVWLWLRGSRRPMFLAGLLSGVAVFLRYQNGLVAIGLLIALLASVRRREAIFFVAGAASGFLGGAILDLITWGGPLHSLHAYLAYNRATSSAYGVSPWSYYLETAWSSTGISLLILATGLLAAWRRSRALVAIVIAFVVVHSLVPHKEYRFLMPVVPVALALSGIGLHTLLAWIRDSLDWVRPRLAAVVVAAVMVVLMTVQTVGATFASTGQWADQPDGAEPVWHHSEGANLGLAAAGRRDDLCGVLLAGLGAVWSGGFTYLHRDVPFLDFENAPNPGSLLPFANYVILAPGIEPPPGYLPVQDFRGWSLRRRDGTCAPAPGLTRELSN